MEIIFCQGKNNWSHLTLKSLSPSKHMDCGNKVNNAVNAKSGTRVLLDLRATVKTTHAGVGYAIVEKHIHVQESKNHQNKSKFKL